MDTYYELQEDTIKKFNDIFNEKSFPVNVGFEFIGHSKQKDLIKIAKIPDQYAFLLKKEILVSINEELFDIFAKDNTEAIDILMEQEINKININTETGKIKFTKTDLNTFSSIVNKYGVEKVARANQVEDLYDEQKKDGKDNFII